MRRSSLSLLAASFAAVCSLHAQTTNPLIAETKAAYNAEKGYLTRAAASMPEESYSFKPTPEIRTFGELLAHIADHQTRLQRRAGRGPAGRRGFQNYQGRSRSRSGRVLQGVRRRVG